jgi:maleate cis-trans isomerase
MLEPELYKMAPAGVSVHFSKIKEDEEDLRRMAGEIPRAAAELADAEVNIIAFGCTVGSLIGGTGYDEQLLGLYVWQRRMGRNSIEKSESSLKRTDWRY